MLKIRRVAKSKKKMQRSAPVAVCALLLIFFSQYHAELCSLKNVHLVTCFFRATLKRERKTGMAAYFRVFLHLEPRLDDITVQCNERTQENERTPYFVPSSCSCLSFFMIHTIHGTPTTTFIYFLLYVFCCCVTFSSLLPRLSASMLPETMLLYFTTCFSSHLRVSFLRFSFPSFPWPTNMRWYAARVKTDDDDEEEEEWILLKWGNDSFLVFLFFYCCCLWWAAVCFFVSSAISSFSRLSSSCCACWPSCHCNFSSFSSACFLPT